MTMRLFIQIPCFNEAEMLPVTLADLPRSLPGFSSVEILVIDDGSSDDTATVARAHGAHYVVSNRQHLGLAQTFMRGLEECLRRGADVIVNTDADNQYQAADIPALVAPIRLGRADIVIGARPIADTAHFSLTKKFLQRLGSRMVAYISNTDIPDAPSGFRAFSRRAAAQMNVFTEYTYTLETIIQAGQKRIPIVSVPIRTNPPTRPSRLVRSNFSYVRRSLLTMLRIGVIYRPLRLFAWPGMIAFIIGVILGLRFTAHWWLGHGQGMVQSLIAAALLIALGASMMLMGVLSDLVATNRKLLEKINLQLKLSDRSLAMADLTAGLTAESATDSKTESVTDQTVTDSWRSRA